MNKPNLSQLPLHFQKISKRWWKDTKTGQMIPADKITDHLPKPPEPDEQIIAKRWDLKY